MTASTGHGASAGALDPARLEAARLLAAWLEGRGAAAALVSRFEATPRAQGPQWPYVRRRRLRELMFGVVRLQGRYRTLVDVRVRRPADVDARVRAVLYVALHELCEHDAAPFAVVDQAVRVAKQLGAARAAGFVNAVLRGVLRDGVQAGLPDPHRQPLEYAIAWLSHPEWMVRRWAQRLPPDELLALCAANNRRPPLVIRVPAGDREQADRTLASLEWEARPHPLAEGALEMVTRVPAPLLLARLPQRCALQDAAAQLVTPLLTAARPRRILDLCAAPGGKCTQLATSLDQDDALARVVGVDVAPGRLRMLAGTLQRMQLRNVDLVAGDGRCLPLRGGFDAVLVDAPCTGTGVLARRHDARWRRAPEDLERLPRLQVALLRAAADAVRPGGTIVYATCSLEPEENDAVVERVLGERPDLIERSAAGLVPDAVLDGTRMRVWPHRHAADGAFAAVLQRAREAVQ